MTLPTVHLNDADHEPSNTVDQPIERVIDHSHFSRTHAGNTSGKKNHSLVHASWIFWHR